MINICNKNFNELTFSDIENSLLNGNLEENIFIEFKSADISHKKICKEIAAFANTYGGYLIIGVEDNGEVISDCKNKWSEERINNIIFNNVVPLPVIDIKKVKKDQKTIFLIKVNEGLEPPYVVNNGNIYTRVSSSSVPIKDSGTLNHMFSKRQEMHRETMDIINIDEISANEGVLASIDVGFRLFSKNNNIFREALSSCDLNELYNKVFKKQNAANIRKQTGSLYVIVNYFRSKDIEGNDVPIPVNLSNFMEIMWDGSCRFRFVMMNNDKNSSLFNFYHTYDQFICFENIYKKLFKNIMSDNFIYALKRQKLCVFKQFSPYMSIISKTNHYKHTNKNNYKSTAEINNNIYLNKIVTSDVFPKHGFEKICQQDIVENKEINNSISIIERLLLCDFFSIPITQNSSL